MNAKQIYNHYLIPPNLQKHMLRVAALSSLLVENWNELPRSKLTGYRFAQVLVTPYCDHAASCSVLCDNKKTLDQKSIILACVFHDMGNIIKFNFNKPPLFKEEENQTDYWKKIQTEFIQKYGNNVHLATFKICREIGLPEKVLNIIKKLNWNKTLEILAEEDFESAIPIYCDMRIGPFGIMLLKDRIDNLATRNKSHNMTLIKKAAAILEATLQKNLSIDLNQITDTELNNRFNELLTKTISE